MDNISIIIREQCDMFCKEIISMGDALTNDELVKRMNNANRVIYYTYQDDDTIDIDFEDMCFTVGIENGLYKLYDIATYYREDGGAIEVHL